MKKNDILEGVCSNYNHEGSGVVRVNDIVFIVPYVLKGEHISFRVLKVSKKIGYGKLEEVITPSKNRIVPICPYFTKCGGCHLQHMNREEQASFKTSFVEDNTRKIAKCTTEVQPILDMEFQPYRNKAQFPISIIDNKLHIGFYRKHSHDIIDIESCAIQSSRINDVLSFLRNHLISYDFTYNLRHILVKHAYKSDELMIVFVTNRNIDIPKEFIGLMHSNLPNIASVQINVNTSNSNVILGKEEHIIEGNYYIEESIDEYTFQLSSKSFFQVNPFQTPVLYNTGIEKMNLTEDDNIIELYSGTGSISLCLSKYVKHITGVEIVESAVKDANRNKQINNVSNVDFICKDAGEYAQEVLTDSAKVDALVVDPPRKGLDMKGIDAIKKMNASKILYISCNPSTLARDIELLSDVYDCSFIQPVDMFPMTYHVEIVALLSQLKMFENI